ncbi:hypothetical protein N0V90_009108 [Kalmusia sp. IMI 367209]|nr:hypothetical protein N0V90_009108 [Kalmusia sp. IMI 367209]
MARQKKEEVELNISMEQFTRTRDSSAAMSPPRRIATQGPRRKKARAQLLTLNQVIMSLSNLQKGLAHVQNGLNDMMNAYIKHTASVLAGEDGAIESLQLPDNVLEMAAAANFAVNNVASTVAAVPAAADADAGKGKKRKREKRVKDPNQPKRPLTAAFLYAQSARPIVRKDLENELEPGAKLEPNAINLEVNKRWNEMAEEEKETWKASYRESMEQYNKDMAAYKASKGVAAAEEAEVIPEEASDEGEVAALDSDVDSSSDEEEPSPVKALTPPPATNGKTSSRKRQKTTATPQVNGSSGPVAIAPGPTPVPLPSNVRSQAAASSAVEATPAKKDNKKKKAAEKPQAIASAPAAKEPSPDETKKKPKSGRATRNAEPEGEEKPTKKRERSKRKSEGVTS